MDALFVLNPDFVEFFSEKLLKAVIYQSLIGNRNVQTNQPELTEQTKRNLLRFFEIQSRVSNVTRTSWTFNFNETFIWHHDFFMKNGMALKIQLDARESPTNRIIIRI